MRGGGGSIALCSRSLSLFYLFALCTAIDQGLILEPQPHSPSSIMGQLCPGSATASFPWTKSCCSITWGARSPDDLSIAALIHYLDDLSTAAVVAMASAAVLFPSQVFSVRRLLTAEVPRAYASLLAWLSPPYLYLVLNAIIICIAASSRFGQYKSPAHAADQASPPVGMVSHRMEDVPPPVLGEEYDDVGGGMDREDEEEEEGPGMFNHRKGLKSGHEDKGLRRVAKPRRAETLESTWRAITEGRAVPLARHLRKADTWDTRAAREDAASAAVRMSETVSNDDGAGGTIAGSSQGVDGGCGGSSLPPWTTPSGVGRARVRREPSPGQEELNRQVEAFIEKFNGEMRLQRQKSLQQFMEMMNQDT